MTAAGLPRLASGRTVAHSALWNLLGRIGPILIAIAVTPQLVALLGPSRWGVFTIALSLVGIFGIFDFGIGRALTRMISERLAHREEEQAAGLVFSGLLVLAILGVVGGIVVAALAGYWTRNMLRIPQSLQLEVQHALFVLSISAPLVIVNSALWGVIAAYQRFKAANLVNIPIMAMYYIGPLISLYWVNSLVSVMAVLVLCRLVMTFAYWRIATAAMPSLLRAQPNLRELPGLLTIGGWMTVSNIAYPLLGYVDRFVIASVLSAAATGYYATPLDLVGRFSILNIAVMNTVFPAIASSYRVAPAATIVLYKRATLAIAILLFCPCLAVTAFSHEILTVWLGAPFADHAARVMVWLGIGVFVLSLDGVVAGMLDGIGRPDVNAKYSILQLALYIPALAVLVRAFGIEGAAIAYTARTIVDFGSRLALVCRYYPPVRATSLRLAPILAGGTLLLALPWSTHNVAGRIVLMALASALFAGAVWRLALDPAERRRTLVAVSGRLGLQRFVPVRGA